MQKWWTTGYGNSIGKHFFLVVVASWQSKLKSARLPDTTFVVISSHGVFDLSQSCNSSVAGVTRTLAGYQAVDDSRGRLLRVAEQRSPHISATPAVSRARSGRQGSTAIQAPILKHFLDAKLFPVPLRPSQLGYGFLRPPNGCLAALQDGLVARPTNWRRTAYTCSIEQDAKPPSCLESRPVSRPGRLQLGLL
ncbi:hypothetical protein VTN96DRAFT_6058 [Rasamsonia emersonii]